MLSLTYFYSLKDINRDESIDSLVKHCDKYKLIFVDICIDDHPEMEAKYLNKTPAICIGPYVLYSPFTETELIVATNSAIDRQNRLIEENDPNYKKRVKNSLNINGLDKFTYFFSRFYVLVISAIISIFVLIPFLAPVLEKSGHTGPANIIYKVYHVICHQLDFRSFFLYGKQAFYPRALAQMNDVITYEEMTGRAFIDLNFSRNDIGNAFMGYKVAICERDVAIYGSLALFGFIFHITHKKIKQLPWYLWLVIALMPIAIDGISQIPGLSSGWPAWLPVRESTPFLRVLTGTLFGAGTAWYMYPMMEESMKETRLTLHRKMAIVNKINREKALLNNE